MKFEAEVRQVQSKKLVSNDIEYKVVFTTNDPTVLGLGAIDPQTVLTVEVSTNG